MRKQISAPSDAAWRGALDEEGAIAVTTDILPEATRRNDDATRQANSGTSESVSVSAPWSAVGPFLSALGTGVGLVGFVVFIGGAILWTQADSAGLPASETVALVPKSVLLSTGAHFLTAAVLLALLGVGVLWAYDTFLRDKVTKEQARAELETEQKRFTLERELEDAKRQLAPAEEARTLALTAYAAASEAASQTAAAAAASARAAAAAGASPVSVDHEAFAAAVTEADARRALAEEEADATRKKLEEAQERFDTEMPALAVRAAATRHKRDNRELLTRLASLGIPLLVFELLVTTFASIAWYDYLALVALSAATTSIILVIYTRTKGFSWFAVSAFVAIGLYMGFATYFRTRDAPKAEPAAALINGRSPVVGYFIAQTSDRIYFGIPPQGSSPARMVSLRRDDVVALAVGRLMPIKHDRALDTAKALAVSLCADLLPDLRRATPRTPAGPTPVCPRSG